MRYCCSNKQHEPSGWCFLDLDARRWYVVNEDGKEVRHYLFQGIVGMDAGLGCQWVDPLSSQKIIVYNPIAKTHKELLAAPEHLTSEFYPNLNIVVDTDSQGFKILRVNHSFDTERLDDPSTTLEERLSILNDPLLRVYDSAAGEWKGVSNPSCIRSGVGHASCVMSQGIFYVFLPSFSLEGEHPFARYNLAEDVGKSAFAHPRRTPSSQTYSECQSAFSAGILLCIKRSNMVDEGK